MEKFDLAYGSSCPRPILSVLVLRAPCSMLHPPSSIFHPYILPAPLFTLIRIWPMITGGASIPDAMKTRPPRILYAAGPGDIIGTYRHWKAGRDDPSQVAITYSGQFYSLCRELGAQGLVISYCPRVEQLSDGEFRLEHRPVRFGKGPGALYHLGQIWYGLRLTVSANNYIRPMLQLFPAALIGFRSVCCRCSASRSCRRCTACCGARDIRRAA